MAGFFQRIGGVELVVAGLVACFCMQLGAPAKASAEDAATRPDWVPAFAFFGGFASQKNSGSVSSTPDGMDLDQIPFPPLCETPGQRNCFDSSRGDPFPVSQRYFAAGVRQAVNPDTGELEFETDPVTGEPETDPVTGEPIPKLISGWLPNTVGPFSGSSRSVFPHVGASIELAAPLLSVGPLQRIGAVPFIHGDVALTFDTDHTVATQGDPSSPRVPTLSTNTPPSLDTVSGVGSRVSGEVQPWVFGAGAGLSFEFPMLGRTIRIKPSVEYRYDKVTVSAFASAAGAGASVFATNPISGEQVASLCPCITSQTSGTQTESFHSLGPGLEIEMDAARAGPFMLTFFLSGGYYQILGNRDVEVEGSASWTNHEMFGGALSPYTQSFPDEESREAQATFGYLEDPTLDTLGTYERDKFIYRANVGLRFRWLPE